MTRADASYRTAALPGPGEHGPWMREALALAREAAAADEVPVGAVVVNGKQVIGRGRDARAATGDPTAHAEILAIRAAAATLGDWRLEGCALFVTLEPCPMCAGAILLARVPLLVYGAPNAKFGAVETQQRLLGHPGWNHRVVAVSGVLADECASLLTGYFARKRRP
jgi:tRNA(adenine34) deaminase